MLALNNLKKWASNIGFDDCGAAIAVRLDEDALFLQQWINSGHHGSMLYMQENFEKRVNPQVLVPGAKTVVVGLLNYYVADKQPVGAPYIAQSGMAKEDYHVVMKGMLSRLEEQIVKEGGDDVVSHQHQHLFCDSAPILERRWAQRAGLGWIGKNRQFIHPRFGSFVHIGILILNEELDHYSTAFENDGCNNCDICRKSCPTGALRGNLFDARKCISYLTIERKEELENKYKKVVADNLYGCDICAKVCPYNQNLQPTSHPQLQANPKLTQMTASDWRNTSRRQRLKLLHRLAK